MLRLASIVPPQREQPGESSSGGNREPRRSMTHHRKPFNVPIRFDRNDERNVHDENEPQGGFIYKTPGADLTAR